MYGKYFVLFAIMFTGYVMRKANFINSAMNDGLNKFIVYFAYPCLLVINIGKLKMNGDMIVQFLIMLGITCGLFAVYAALARLYTARKHIPKRAANVAELSMSAPNDGFMGFPVALIFFGQQGLFLMMAHNVALNIYFFSYGLICLRRNNADRPRIDFKTILQRTVKIILNPNLVAVYIGIFISLSGISLDNAPGEYLGYMGNVATPMAMIFIGSSLAGSKFSEMLKNRIVWGSAIMKLILLPAVTALIVWFLPISALMKAMLILGCCFPSGATVSMLAQQEKQNEEVASRILFFTTVLSMGTIPIAIDLIQMGLF
ncbi:MAG: AEC family transporter [Eubacteriaceae bacterium]|nr:AEC family transporter [Eubacteriaceae bacterium]